MTEYTFAQSRNSHCGAPDVSGALRSVGLAPVDARELRLDGVLCRFRAEGDGPGRKNAWLVAHLDGLRPLVVCGSWRTNETHTIPLGHAQALTPHDQAQIHASVAAANAQRDREVRHRQAGAQRLAIQWWAESPAAPADHPYLARKRIGVHGARTSGDKLLIPMRDEHGGLWSVQTIRADGDKRFLAGGRCKGLAARIGTDGDHARILLAEGWATGATLHEATGRPVYCAMSASNLIHVARWLREKYPTADICVCADNDTETEARTGRNPGVECAREAAAAIGARLAIPPISGDFNDYGATAPKDIFDECATESGN